MAKVTDGNVAFYQWGFGRLELWNDHEWSPVDLSETTRTQAAWLRLSHLQLGVAEPKPQEPPPVPWVEYRDVKNALEKTQELLRTRTEELTMDKALINGLQEDLSTASRKLSAWCMAFKEELAIEGDDYTPKEFRRHVKNLKAAAESTHDVRQLARDLEAWRRVPKVLGLGPFGPDEIIALIQKIGVERDQHKREAQTNRHRMDVWKKDFEILADYVKKSNDFLCSLNLRLKE
jgi:signal recognition particle subunit SEC65